MRNDLYGCEKTIDELRWSQVTNDVLVCVQLSLSVTIRVKGSCYNLGPVIFEGNNIWSIRKPRNIVAVFNVADLELVT